MTHISTPLLHMAVPQAVHSVLSKAQGITHLPDEEMIAEGFPPLFQSSSRPPTGNPQNTYPDLGLASPTLCHQIHQVPVEGDRDGAGHPAGTHCHSHPLRGIKGSVSTPAPVASGQPSWVGGTLEKEPAAPGKAQLPPF